LRLQRCGGGVSARAKPALAAAKVKGVKLGNRRIEAARVCTVASLKPDRAASNVLPIIGEIKKSGACTLRAIAEALNARGVALRAAVAGTQRAFAMCWDASRQELVQGACGVVRE
jgi:hypothetical protein